MRFLLSHICHIQPSLRASQFQPWKPWANFSNFSIAGKECFHWCMFFFHCFLDADFGELHDVGYFWKACMCAQFLEQFEPSTCLQTAFWGLSYHLGEKPICNTRCWTRTTYCKKVGSSGILVLWLYFSATRNTTCCRVVGNSFDRACKLFLFTFFCMLRQRQSFRRKLWQAWNHADICICRCHMIDLSSLNVKIDSVSTQIVEIENHLGLVDMPHAFFLMSY